jgi:hypothetical protein
MEVSGQLPGPGRFTRGEIPTDTHWMEGWVDPKAGLDQMENLCATACPYN